MRAAQYLRMSTERQEYSIDNQETAIRQYAKTSGFEIVATYSDPAKSGLTLKRRPGLGKLLQDVIGGNCGYHAVLVYDISRWGRFQDVDESAYYEFLCKKAGVRVLYCAEPFDSADGTTMGALFKSLKRAMAGEYLRELSQKVFAGQQRIGAMGYKLGGAAGYGLRRLLVSRDGDAKGILNHHDWKTLDSDRVVYVLGPPDEVEVVRRMFDWFVKEELSAPQIADRLNEMGVRRSPYGKWTQSIVIDMLKHPKYMGMMVYNRVTKKLGTREKRNTVDKFLIVPNCFPAIIEPEVFNAAQRRLVRPRDLTDQQMLHLLRQLLASKGKVTADIIDEAPDVPCSQTYIFRFGTLGNAYKEIGYSGANRAIAGGHGSGYITKLRNRLQLEIAATLEQLGNRVRCEPKYIDVDHIGLFRIAIATALFGRGRWRGWYLKIGKQTLTRRFLVIRLASDYTTILDYLILETVEGHKHLLISDEMAALTGVGRTVSETAAAISQAVKQAPDQLSAKSSTVFGDPRHSKSNQASTK